LTSAAFLQDSAIDLSRVFFKNQKSKTLKSKSYRGGVSFSTAFHFGQRVGASCEKTQIQTGV